MKLERKIPNLDSSLLMPLYFDGKMTESQYIEEIEKFERRCEEKITILCLNLGIKAMVKTDPYSLPYTDELVFSLFAGSFLNRAYEFERVAYKILKEILNKDLYQFRFYIFINVMPNKYIGSVEYRFRYYDKNKRK